MEGKESFILYVKYIQIFNALNLEQRGILITHILNYVNDLVPEGLEDKIDDPIVKMAWIPIKMDLKDDLKKWNNIVKRNQINGIKGGRPKKEENPKNPMGNLDKKEKPKKPKKADSDNEYEYDSEYDNDNEVSKDTNINVSFNKETTPEATKNMPPVVISLPCLKGYNHLIYEDDINHYQDLYPAVNVHQELKLMLGWLESNPNNRKTKNGIKAFITRWLSKKQDKAPTNTEGYKPPKPKRSDFDSIDDFYKAYDEWAIKYNNGFNEFELAENKIGNSDGWKTL